MQPGTLTGVAGLFRWQTGGAMPDPMQFKQFDFAADSIVEGAVLNGVPGWTADGYFSAWGVQDAEGDVTHRGAFARTFAEGLPLVKYEHGPTTGKTIAAKEDDYGPWVRMFFPTDPATDFIHKLMKIGAVAKMSYGWKPYPGGMTARADGGRDLTAVQLFEVSPVAIPMLDATAITEVKAGANGLPDAPLDVQLTAAGLALKAACCEAEAHQARRVEAYRALSEKNAAAVGELAELSGEAMLSLLYVETKAGRAVAGSRKRFVADMMRALRSFIDSLPEEERGQVEAMLNDATDASDDKTLAEADALELALLAAEFPGLITGG